MKIRDLLYDTWFGNNSRFLIFREKKQALALKNNVEKTRRHVP